MKNRVHVTFDTPEAADKLFSLLQNESFLAEHLDILTDEIKVKPHVEIELFTNVHSLHSLNITTKEIEEVRLIECKECGMFEEMPAQHPRHKAQNFTWLQNLDKNQAMYNCEECDESTVSMIIPKAPEE